MTLAELHTQFVAYLERRENDALTREAVALLTKDFLAERGENVGLAESLLDRMFGFGVLEPLLRDATITEIMVNGPTEVWIESSGVLQKTNIQFENDDEIITTVNRLAGASGRRLDATSPLVDVRLSDGSRLNAIISPLSKTGPTVTIRKFPARAFTLESAILNRSISSSMAKFLAACVRAKQNILIVGATGSGKTSLLNALAGKIPAGERLVIIEDTAEISVCHEHTVQLEARQANIEGKGEIGIRALLANALRMRPDRILIGEVRGGEALDMLQAMHTGHAGSISTVHANSTSDAVERIATMALMAEVGVSDAAIRRQIARAINYVVQTSRLPEGSRKVVTIDEVVEEQGAYKLIPLFYYSADGRTFVATGTLPERLHSFSEAGIDIDPEWFI